MVARHNPSLRVVDAYASIFCQLIPAQVSSGTPDWIAASLGGGGGGDAPVVASAVSSGRDGGLDWLAQAVDPAAPAILTVAEGTCVYLSYVLGWSIPVQEGGSCGYAI